MSLIVIEIAVHLLTNSNRLPFSFPVLILFICPRKEVPQMQISPLAYICLIWYMHPFILLGQL